MEDNRKYLENIRKELEAVYNGTAINEDGEPADFLSWINENVLDHNYIINADKSYKACSLLITFGGPNIYINTWDQEIQLFWGGDHETLRLPSEIANEIDYIMEEYYKC